MPFDWPDTPLKYHFGLGHFGTLLNFPICVVILKEYEKMTLAWKCSNLRLASTICMGYKGYLLSFLNNIYNQL